MVLLTKDKNMSKTTATILILITLFIGFYGGRYFEAGQQKAEFSRRFDEMMGWTTQCDLPMNDGLGTVIEVDCFTPQAYKVMNKYFSCVAEDYSRVPCDYWRNEVNKIPDTGEYRGS